MIHRKFRLITTVLTLLVLLFSSCTTTATTPIFYSNNSNYDFIILGEVIYESTTKVGFQELLRAARSKYPNCDYVIDVMVDSTTTIVSFLPFLFPPKTSITYTMRGTAIQYIRNIPEGYEISVSSQSPSNSTETVASIEYTVQDSYTVVGMKGQVERYVGNGRWATIKVGDILDKGIFVDTASYSSLYLTDGNITIAIPANNRNTIEELVKKFIH